MAPDAIPLSVTTTPPSILPYISNLLGWTYFLCWAISSYPQPYINFRRRSVTGLSIDYFLLNILGHTCYTLSSLSFLYIPLIRTQYTQRWGSSLGPPTVRVNDLAFTAHALFWSCVTFTQFFWWGFARSRAQRVSRFMKTLIAACIALILLTILMVLVFDPEVLDPATGAYVSGWQWLDVVYYLGHIKLATSVVKYYPQARLNYLNQSTVGWSIHKCALDFTGSVLSLVQLGIDASLTPGGLRSVVGNPLKFCLGFVSVGFDVVFGWQHWVLYPEGGRRKEGVVVVDDEEGRGLLGREEEGGEGGRRNTGVYGSLERAADHEEGGAAGRDVRK
ncbi:PQ loop repeat-domain-containing protein [Peziza echinospora]|nr:PQ loop repeat-domain-containing protein [Peziza echinospora]